MDIDNLLPNVRHQRIDANGLTFHVATAGPTKGPLVMLLHGFPEFWYGWRHQIAALVEAGFSVAAPKESGHTNRRFASSRSNELGNVGVSHKAKSTARRRRFPV